MKNTVDDDNNGLLSRNPELMGAEDTVLLVLDAQEKLVPLVAGHQRVVWNIRRLIEGAATFGMCVTATEQYPQGLGPMVAELAGPLQEAGLKSIPAKTSFSCGGCADVVAMLRQWDRPRVLVVGIETHVCVQQSTLDLLAAGYRMYVAADAVGARQPVDHETALRRMDSAGVTLTTTESALCEWCRDSSVAQFKRISALLKEQPPG